MVTFQYVLCHLLLLLISYISCLNIKDSSSDKAYWKYSSIPIIVYTLEEGLRWGRDIDWCAYSYEYEQLGKGVDTGHEYLFQKLWFFFSFLGLSYPFVVTICTFVVIFSFFYFIQPYRKYTYLIIPLLIAWSGPKTINFIRWFFALSFVLIGLRRFLDGKRKSGLCLAFCCSFLHLGTLPLAILTIIISRFKRIIIKPYVAIIISIILVVMFNVEFLKHFSNVFVVFSNFERMSSYGQDPNFWLSAKFERKGIEDYLATMIPFYLYLYYGHKYKQDSQDSHDSFLCNMAVVGLIVRSVSSGIELLDRYAISFDIFFVILSVWCYYYLKNNWHKKHFYKIISAIVIATFALQVYKFYKPLDNEIKMHYYWDSNLPPAERIAPFYEI